MDSPITVEGTGEAGASVSIDLLSNSVSVGTATGTVDSSGNFSVVLTYTAPAKDAAMDLQVTLANTYGTSQAATLALTQGGPPEAPTLTAPVANAEVNQSFTVTGTAEANATVNLVLTDSSSAELGTAEATASGTGAFAVNFPFSGGTNNEALTLSATATNDFGTSPATDQTLVNKVTFQISGTVSQAAGTFAGTQVHVRLYDSATEVVHHLDEAVISVSNGLGFTGEAFSFGVTDGTYYLRAFRDSTGHQSATPDGQPSVTDPQAPASAPIVVNASVPGLALTLIPRTSNDEYERLNAQTNHDSAEARAPYYEDPPSSGNYVPGDGLCSGYYLKLEARANGIALTAPQVILPDSSVVTLLDDGGCGQDVHDNTSMGYDRQASDGEYGFGINEPDASRAGDYTFFYRQTVDDFIHIHIDNIAAITKLERRIRMTQPSAAAANTDLTPTLVWDAIPNAGSYLVYIRSNDGPYEHEGFTNTNEYTPTVAFDNTTAYAYSVDVQVVDTDVTVGDFDIDAQAFGTHNAFVTDPVGGQTVTISGQIINNTSATGLIFIRAGANNVSDATLWLDPEDIAYTGDYTITVLRDTDAGCDSTDEPDNIADCDKGRIQGFIDVDGSGERDSPVNNPYENGFEDIPTDIDTTGQDIIFNEPVVVLQPTANAMLPSDAGQGEVIFSWEDYSVTAGVHAPAVFSYGLYYTPYASGGDDFPQNIWGLSSNTTSFDINNPPDGLNKFDVVGLLGPESSSTSMGPGEWGWGVVILACDYQLYLDGTDTDPANGTNDYIDCIEAALDSETGIVAESGERRLTVMP
ncbi:MAG: hypothetical protein R3C68_13850 [Myxococcota bacterium]